MKVAMKKFGADIAGLVAHGLIVAGVWGRFGWSWGLIVAGAPFAAFYFWGEYRSSRGDA